MMRALFIVLSTVAAVLALDTAGVRYNTAAVPVVDGALSDPAWALADTLHDFKFPWGNDRGTVSKVLLLWDDSALYVGAVMKDAKLVAVCTTGTGIDGDEMVETHMSPDIKRPDYFYILEHNLNLISRSGFRHGKATGKNDWVTPWTRVNRVTKAVVLKGSKNNNSDVDTGWTEEIRIPFSALSGWEADTHTAPAGWAPATPPVAGTAWRFNICRQNQDSANDANSDWSIWSHNGSYPYGTGMDGVHLHDYNNFGVIVFTKSVAVEAGLVETGAAMGLCVSPNPSSSKMRIQTDMNGVFSARVYNVDGKLTAVLSGNGKGAVWDASRFPAGVYVVRAVVGNRMLTRAVTLIR